MQHCEPACERLGGRAGSDDPRLNDIGTSTGRVEHRVTCDRQTGVDPDHAKWVGQGGDLEDRGCRHSREAFPRLARLSPEVEKIAVTMRLLPVLNVAGQLLSTELPTGAIGSVFEGHTECGQLIADLVGKGKVLGLADLGS